MIFRNLSECKDNKIWPISNTGTVSNRCHRLTNPSHSTILHCTSSHLTLRMDNSPSNFVSFKAFCSRYSSGLIDLATNLHLYSPLNSSYGAYQLHWICYLDIWVVMACRFPNANNLNIRHIRNNILKFNYPQLWSGEEWYTNVISTHFQSCCGKFFSLLLPLGSCVEEMWLMIWLYTGSK